MIINLKKSFYELVVIGIIIFAFVSCNSTRNIFKSSSSKKNFFIINAVTLSHCGCSEIYAESYKNGKKEFQIFYNDNLARKTIYSYNSDSREVESKSLLATPNDNFSIPFDSLDFRIFTIIDSTILKGKVFVYPIRRTIYKGYVTDTLIQR